MNATKDHISLETAKMLKDCELNYDCTYVENYDDVIGWSVYREGEVTGEQYDYGFFSSEKLHHWKEFYPAFTWQEILWEHEENFFEAGEIVKHTQKILLMIQAKLYNEADEYFREHCVLIKK